MKRAIEYATTQRADAPTHTRQAVRTATGTRSEMLPVDPLETAKLLRARRAKKTPAARAKERIAADLKRRGR